MGSYGYFDDKTREYVITNPLTPVKWINYIGTLKFGGFVDHTGGALLCKGDPAENRLTKYIQQMPSGEFKGTSLYLRVAKEKGFQLLSPLFVPGLETLDRYECRVGLGYSRFITEVAGIRTECLVFVPQGKACEVRQITVTNVSQQSVNIDAIPVVEYSHMRSYMQLTNADWVPQTMVSHMHEEKQGKKIILQYPFMYRDTKVNYFTSSWAVSSFETDRKNFLGNNEYGTWANPLALQQSELGNYVAKRGDNICALLHHLGTLKSGESQSFVTLLGQEASLEIALPLIEKFRKTQEVDKAFAELGQFWDEYLEKQQVKTPSESLNHMVNVHNARQCYITKNWSRYLSYYQLGLGARGIGFRDSAQDVLGVLPSAAGEGKELINQLLRIQSPEGWAWHQVNPLTGIASSGESEEYSKGQMHFYGDDHLWIILSVCEYIKESGDFAYLDEKLSYYNPQSPQTPTQYGTVFEHLQLALKFTREHSGKNGLPLLYYADWNDTVNLPLGSESLHVANLYGWGLKELIALCKHLDKKELIKQYQTDWDSMSATVNAAAWDGEWWIRYIDEKGQPLGSHKNDVCRIYCNGQSWPVLSGFASGERAVKGLESLHSLLNTQYGIKIASPGYNGMVEGVGGIATYPPGAKENCGIFLHTNPWVMIANCMLGNGERAFEYYQQINPADKNEIIDLYEIEPYAYAQNILADEHPQFGLGRNSWLSGTASWSYQAATKWILGLRPEYGGLRIDPCIPKAWKEFSIKRVWRGAEYHIHVRNPHNVNKGVREIILNGNKIEHSQLPLLPVLKAGTTCQVEVILG